MGPLGSLGFGYLWTAVTTGNVTTAVLGVLMLQTHHHLDSWDSCDCWAAVTARTIGSSGSFGLLGLFGSTRSSGL